MKTTQLTTSKANCLVVEMPEYSRHPKVFNDGKPYISYFIGLGTDRLYIPSGNWSILGMLHTLTDEQIKMFLHEMKDSSYPFEVQEMKVTLEMFLQANEVYLSNPLGAKPIYKGGFFHAGFETDNDKEQRMQHVIDLNKWQDFENKVFRNGLVLISEI